MNEVERFCKKHEPCIDGAKWAKQYATLADVYDNCKRGDWLIWMLDKANKIELEQERLLAIEFAERVLPIFERRYLNDDRPRKAIEAAKNSSNSRHTAYDAARAANAAYAAYDKSDEQRWQADRIREVIQNPWRKT